MARIRLRGISLAYPDGTHALNGIDLVVGDRELLALVGPSGGGKTSLLRVVAGLERPGSGVVEFDGVEVTALPPSMRDVGMIFQDLSLVPNWSAASNIEFPLLVRHVGKVARTIEAEAQGRRVGLSTRQLRRRPGHLSAGHQQLVAAGRALVRHPRVLLADEPLAHLDADLRHHVRSELVRLHRQEGTTTLYATNDPSDAMAVADRLAVVRDGRISQVGPPLEVYREPIDLFVAQFLGSVPMNAIPAVVAGSLEAPFLEIVGDRIALGRYSPTPIGTRVVLGVRPENLTLATSGTPFDRCLHGRVERVEHVGSHALARVRCGETVVLARVPVTAAPASGNDVELALTQPAHLRLFDPVSGRTLD